MKSEKLIPPARQEKQSKNLTQTINNKNKKTPYEYVNKKKPK